MLSVRKIKPYRQAGRQTDRHVFVSLSVNVTKNFNQRRDDYLPLVAKLKRLYDKFTFEIIPITIEATGLLTNNLNLMLKPNKLTLKTLTMLP